MKVLVVGNPQSHEEFKSKFKDYQPTRYKISAELSPEDVKEADVVFDFSTDELAHGNLYLENGEICLFINSVKSTLLQVQQDHDWKQVLVGFNGIPSLFNRPLLELTLVDASHESKLHEVCKTLDTEYVLVADRVGMVTPRVICMIINEAFYTVQEGTATASDINLGMKLGTRYPSGPFEFADAIGVKNVYEILDVLYNDTRDERYKICPQLKREYLRNG